MRIGDPRREFVEPAPEPVPQVEPVPVEPAPQTAPPVEEPVPAGV